MSKWQRDKGAVGEREWASQLTEAGFPAHRGRQYKGTNDSPDVICPALDPLFHCEVKRVERLNVPEAWDKAKREAAPGKLTYVAHRRDRWPWLITMSAEDFFKVIRTAYMELTSAQCELVDGKPVGLKRPWLDDQLGLDFPQHKDGRKE